MTSKPTHDLVSSEYCLDESLDITRINQLYEELNTLLSGADTITMNAGNVKRMDTAGLQLLCCWHLEAKKKGLDVTWINTQGVFTDSAKLLGVAEIFDL